MYPLLSVSPHNQEYGGNAKHAPNRKVFHYHDLLRLVKKKIVALSSECIQTEITKISIPMDFIQIKVISYIKSNTKTP